MMGSNAFKSVRPAVFLAATLLALPAYTNARAQGGIELGILSCRSVPGTQSNLILHSTVDLKCVFRGVGGEEAYNGQTGVALGLDLNWRRSETLYFTVLGGTTDTRIGSYGLTGNYVGGKASATADFGGGEAALFGGGSKNFSLQPVALEGTSGLGVAGGVSYLYLEPDR